MKFEIIIAQDVITDDIPKLPRNWKQKIKEAISKKLATKPHIFGKPLRKSLKGYRRLRVGEYRVVFKIENTIVKIFAIKHRSVVYRTLTCTTH